MGFLFPDLNKGHSRNDVRSQKFLKCFFMRGAQLPSDLKDFLPPFFSYTVAQMVKRLSTLWETRVPSLGREDSLEKGMATHSNTLA